MNEYDSNRIFDTVKKIGYNKTNIYEEANCYVLNTCHIRDKAKEKVYHEIGRVKKIFRSRKKPLVIVTGCVAQAEGDYLMQREKYIDENKDGNVTRYKTTKPGIGINSQLTGYAVANDRSIQKYFRDQETQFQQDLDTKKWKVPFVIEPSAGVDRGVLAVLNEAYKIESLEGGKERVVLSLKPHLSPIKAAVIPLKRNHEGLVSLAAKIKSELQNLRLGRILIENSGNIGKSYRRHDEVGTPLCITVDFDSLEDGTVTLRDRDTMKQKRVSIEEVKENLQKMLNKGTNV